MAMTTFQRFIQAKLTLVAIGAIVATVFFIGRRPTPEPPVFPPPAVVVAQPLVEELADSYDFPGETAAIKQADVRARVEGFLDRICYQDGAQVKGGDLLFVIDPAEYQARRDKAKADLLSAMADLSRAEADIVRLKKAAESAAVSQQDLSHCQAERDKASAIVDARKADLATAELALDYTKVIAPIDGVVSRHLVDVGSLVGGENKTLLAQVTRMDPLYVYFNVSEDVLVKGLKGLRSVTDPPITVSLGTDDSTAYTGHIDYIDNSMDATMGTIQVRGVISNPERALLPGMFVRVTVPTGEPEPRVLVSERSLRRDLRGTYLLLVGDKDIVEKRYVTVGLQVSGMREVYARTTDSAGFVSGIDPAERYILEGVLKARPGAPVNPRER